jgi:predicted metal-dependent peptidase
MKIIDLHNDFLTVIKSNKNKQKYINNKKNNDVIHIASAVWTSEMSQDKAIKEIRKSYEFIYKKWNN